MRFALAQPRDVLQRVPRGHEHDRQRRRFLKRQIGRNSAHIAGARERVRRQSEDGETEHPIAGAQRASTPAPTALTMPANFVAEDARIRALRRDKARAP